MHGADSLLRKRAENPALQTLQASGLYHSFELPDGRQLHGTIPLDVLRRRLDWYGIPNDLRGKRVLDIGPWDGFFTFEAERRGAQVTAIDYVDLDTFRALARIFGSQAQYVQMDLYEVTPARFGTFDLVLCLGVLYHTKHPLLALERCCAVTAETCIIETFVVDAEEWLRGERPPLPYLEFYEHAELAGQHDNWCGPTITAVEALARAAGFAWTEVLHVDGNRASIAAYRRWRNLPAEETPAVEILGVHCHAHRGRSFNTAKEEYVQFWCAWAGVEAPALEDVYPEVDGLGVAPLAAAIVSERLVIFVRVPPGLSSGRHDARVKIGDTAWSKPEYFYIDLPPYTGDVTVVAVQDGLTWEVDTVDWSGGQGGWVSVWTTGLTPEADAGNTTVEIDAVPHRPHTVETSRGQINVRLRPIIGPGSYTLKVIHRGAESPAASLTVRGTPPPVFGLG